MEACACRNKADARFDHHGSLRTGMPEVIYGASEPSFQLISITESLLQHTSPVLVSKVGEEKAWAIRAEFPAMVYHQSADILSVLEIRPCSSHHAGTIAVVCEGSSDKPIAEETAATAKSGQSHRQNLRRRYCRAPEHAQQPCSGGWR